MTKFSPTDIRRIRARRARAAVVATGIIKNATGALDKLDSQLQNMAEDAADRVKERVRRQIDIAPLDAEYAAWKRREGLTNVPLIATKEYINSIVAVRVAPCLYRVTVKDGKHADSDITYAFLSRIHEYGTLDGIPARPHFGPVQREFRRKMMQFMKLLRSQQRKK